MNVRISLIHSFHFNDYNIKPRNSDYGWDAAPRFAQTQALSCPRDHDQGELVS